MGSKKTSRSVQHTDSNRELNDQVTGIAPYQGQFAQQFGELQNQFRNLVGQRPELSLFNGFSSSLDPIIQNQVSKGVQALKSQQSAGDAELANRLSVAGTGSNNALLAALQRQSQIKNAGATNALVPAALEQQRAFDLQKQQILNAENAQKMANYTGNIQALAPGFNLLNAINEMARTSAGRRVTERSDTNAINRTSGSSSYF